MPKQFWSIVLLFVFWLALSAQPQFMMMSLGIASVLLVVYVAGRMGVIGAGEHRPTLYLKLAVYSVWLMWQIIRANIQVAYRVMHPRLPIEPCYLKIKLVGNKPLLHLIHANSITLTPGTISTNIKDGFIYVHSLSDANAQDLLAGKMAKRIAWLQGTHNG